MQNVVSVDFTKAATVWKEGLSADKMTYRFLYKGRKVSMFLRKPGGNWQIHPEKNGKQRWMSLQVSGTTKEDLRLAEKRAKHKLDEVWSWACDRPEAVKIPAVRPFATIGQILDVYEKEATAVAFRDRVDAITAQRNASETRRLIRWANGSATGAAEMEADAVSSAVLDGEKGRRLVERFLENYMAVVETADHRGRNELDVDRRRNGAAHVLRMCRSVFARDKMVLYRGLRLPDLGAFLTAARVPVTNAEHKAIAPDIVAKMDEAAQKLRETDCRLWLVHTALKHLGLRPSELLEARMSWLTESAWGQWFLTVVVSATHRPKASLGYTPLPREVAEAMVRARVELAGEEKLTDGSLLIPGKCLEDRMVMIYRTHSEWMRQWVPAGEFAKSSYELRRWAIQTVRSKYGKEAASDFGRHAAKDVTQAHYLERMYVWRDRAPDGNGGITFADAKGAAKPAVPDEAPRATGWRGLV